MKVRSVDELEDYISKEYAWRRKELTNIRNTALSSRNSMKNLLLKASVSILYSHWEGFIKNISIAFCEYLNSQGFKYQDLKPNFHVFNILNYFDGQFPYKKFDSYLEIVAPKNINHNQNVKIDSYKYIDTKSNLNSIILKDITTKLGLDYSHYELKENLIDESFLALRNAISHGEYREVDQLTFESLYSEISDMMNCFKNQVLNNVNSKEYLI